MSNTLIIIPTYNEKENIEKLISEIFRYVSDVNILIVDDNSPDGTGEIIDKIASKDNRVSVLHRLSNRGRGLAGIEAFKEAVKRKEILYVVEMDADFSHNPRYIPLFLKEIKDADVVIGSRYVKGGKDSDRGYVRVVLSKLVNLFVRKFLNLNIKDCSSGYRCFKKEALVSLDLDRMISEEPSIIEEVLYKCKLKNYRIKEIPIIFKDREAGKTKLGIIKLVRVFIDIFRFKNKMANIVRAGLDIGLSSEALAKEEDVKGSRELRRFGFNLGLGFNIVGVVMFYRYRPHFIWFSAIGSFILILSILYPMTLKPIKKILDSVILLICWLATAVSLSVVFYMIFTPLGILFKFLGKDMLGQKIDKTNKSYWINRKNDRVTIESYEQLG